MPDRLQRPAEGGVKACPACGRLYPAEAGFCAEDGAQLQSVSEVPVVGDERDPRLGQLLCGRYQVRRIVADGGMGRVYEALDIHQRRHVALKVLHLDVARDEVALARFEREFEVSRQLPHAHIVEVYAFLPTIDGSFALVMEYLYGEELRATLRRERTLAPARMVRLVSQVALALDQAHGRRFVHRDLKPDNLFLCQTSAGDLVKILDFGSVKDKTANARKLTVLGTTIGSPFYMAPEQAQGLETLDHRADVWALAAIVYECVTGEVPFQGSNGPSILLEILTKEPVAPSRAGSGARHPVPGALDRVLAAAFRKHPAQRIASAGALADAIGAAYGLSGTHHDWASTAQDELEQRVRMELSPARAVSASSDPEGAFFGAAGGLEGLPEQGYDPFVAEPGSASLSPLDDDGEAVELPTNPGPSPVLLGALVALLALSLGVVFAWLFLRS